jgi:hypothetical protein
MNAERDEYRERNGRLNANTIVSLIGMMLSVIAGTWFVASKVNSAKTDIMSQNVAMKADFVAARTAIESRITVLESRPTKETWTDGDMFRWATRLQRENQNLRVPEPPMKTDTQIPGR